MARLEGIRIKNYRSLRDITLGKLWNTQQVKPLSAITAVIGKNGAGKSSLFDAFGFLADCLQEGVESACDMRGRGGYARLVSQGERGPIEFEVYYRQDSRSRPITYELAIGMDQSSRPFVQRERLRQRRKGQRSGRPFSFLILKGGSGVAWTGETLAADESNLDSVNSFEQLVQLLITDQAGEEAPETESIELTDPRRLGIATLGTLKQHKRISAFREFIGRWYLSYFSPNAARSLPLAGPQAQLNTRGDNLSNVVQFLEREHPDRLANVLTKIAARIPGISTIDTVRTEDGRLLLRFGESGFTDPFYAQQMSDGTLKVFAYLLLLEDPRPAPFIGIEEPENGLFHKLLETLANELRAHAQRPGGAQVFITTHQPYLVDALAPEEVWLLEKSSSGFSTIRRASNDRTITAMVDDGLPLGALWYSDYFDTPGRSDAP